MSWGNPFLLCGNSSTVKRMSSRSLIAASAPHRAFSCCRTDRQLPFVWERVANSSERGGIHLEGRPISSIVQMDRMAGERIHTSSVFESPTITFTSLNVLETVTTLQISIIFHWISILAWTYPSLHHVYVFFRKTRAAQHLRRN